MKMKSVNEIEVLKGGVWEVDQSNRIEELNKNSFVAICRNGTGFCIKIPKKIKKTIYEFYKTNKNTKFFGPQIFARSITSLLRKEKFIPARLEIDLEYPGYEDLITRTIRTYSHQIGVLFKQIGKSSPAHLLAYGFGRKKKNKKPTVEPICGTTADLHPEFTGIRTRTRSS